MAHLLHIIASPMGAGSRSQAIGDAFVAEYRATHPDATVDVWNLWDGTLHDFDRTSIEGRLAIFYGRQPEGEAARAWQEVLGTCRRFDAADRIVLSVPMWNSGVTRVRAPRVTAFAKPRPGGTGLPERRPCRTEGGRSY
jgi:FMN-dependent NADH-azoreductase